MLRSVAKVAVAGLIIVGAFVSAVAADPNPPTLQGGGAWPIRRQWTPAETDHYAKWVENIFRVKLTGDVYQKVAKLDKILTDPQMNLLLDPAFAGEGANPQMPANLIRRCNSAVDCAKFTAFLPLYYAYRRALPWMVSYVTTTGGDVRTSESNIPVGQADSLSAGSLSAMVDAAIAFSTGNYRVELNARNSQWSDTVPVALQKEYLKPGSVMYVDGHSLVLAEVTPYGELRFINASTTPTRDVYTYNGMNAVHGITPKGSAGGDDPYEGCFQGLRVLRFPIAETNSSGRVIKVRRRTDEEMKEFGFSTEQFDRIREITDNQFIEEQGLKPQGFHDFLRLRMKSVDTIQPLSFMEAYAVELVDMWRFREEFIQQAWQDVLQNGPVVYPENKRDENIFQAFGRWETWSSPSSDVDRRNKYFYLADWMEYAIRMYEIQPSFVDLTGLEKYAITTPAGLAQAFIAEKRRIFDAHSMEYTNSKGQKVTLTLSDIEARLFDLSFDPNHPPELRWGAPMGSEERGSAPSRETPLPDGTRVAMDEAYAWQYYYRTIGQREIEPSILRGMFTEGFPVRDKFEGQLAKWLGPGAAMASTQSASTEPEMVSGNTERRARQALSGGF